MNEPESQNHNNDEDSGNGSKNNFLDNFLHAARDIIINIIQITVPGDNRANTNNTTDPANSHSIWENLVKSQRLRTVGIMVLTSLLTILLTKEIPYFTAGLEAKSEEESEEILKEYYENRKDIKTQANALLLAMEKVSKPNFFGIGERSSLYLLQNIYSEITQNQDSIKCKLSSAPLWTVDTKGNKIATGGWSKEVYISDWKSVEECSNKNKQSSSEPDDFKQFQWEADDIITRVRFHPKNESELAVVAGNKISLIQNRKELYSYSHNSNTKEKKPLALLDMDFSPDGKMIALAMEEGSVGIWNYEKTEKVISCVENGKNKPLRSVKFSPELTNFLAAGGEDGQLNLLHFDLFSTCKNENKNDRTYQTKLYGSGTKGWIWSIDFHPNEKLVAVVGGDGIVRLWKLDGNSWRTVHHEWDSQQGRITSVHFSPVKGEILAMGGWDGTIKLWTPSGKPVAEWNALSPVTSLSFRDDEKKIATAHLDGTVRVWTIPTKDELMRQSCYWLNLEPDNLDEAQKNRQKSLCKKYRS